MRKFLLNVLRFQSLLLLSSICVWTLYATTIKWRYKLPSEVHTLFLGNSIIETGIDDSRIPGTFNFGMSADQIDFVYTKLKLFKKANPQIDTVYIGIDNLILFKPFDNNFSSYRINNAWYLTQFDIEDWKIILSNRGFNWRTSYFVNIFDYNSWFYNFFKPINNGSQGGFRRLKRKREPVSDFELEKQKYDEYMTKENGIFGKDFLHFLNKMISFCEENNIHLRFINLPKSPVTWHDRRVNDMYDLYLKGVPFDDFGTLALPDSLFADNIHLNKEGAAIFSEFLKTKR